MNARVDSRSRLRRGPGLRLSLWIAVLVLATSAPFVGLDIRHEKQILSELGSPADRLEATRAQALRLHAVQMLVTVLVLGAGVHLAVRTVFIGRGPDRVEEERPEVTVAWPGAARERAIGPLGRRLLTLSRTMVEREVDRWAWSDVEQTSMRILAELGRLESQEHPSAESRTTAGRTSASGR